MSRVMTFLMLLLTLFGRKCAGARLQNLPGSLKLFQTVSETARPLASPRSSLQESKNKRVGVLLLNLGGPEKLEDVEGFLYNLFSDPDIIQLPKPPCPLGYLQKPLAWGISKSRSKNSAEGYASIGGGSPIKKYTSAQATGLQKILERKGYKKVKTYFAMRYWEPYTEDVLKQIKRDGIQELVIIPLYPHYSISTTASSLKAIDRVFRSDPRAWFKDNKSPSSGLLERCTVVPYWYNRPEYVSVMAKLIAEKYLGNFSSSEQEEGVDILFSAHGVPVSYIDSGDPYRQQMEDCVKLISAQLAQEINILEKERFRQKSCIETYLPSYNGTFNMTSIKSSSEPFTTTKPIRCQLAFQSRVGPVEWLRPYTDDKLREMGAGTGPQGKVKNLIVVPVAFVSEHIETLEEIDIGYRKVAEDAGILKWARVPALNTNSRFLGELAEMVDEALQSPDVSIQDTLVSQLLPKKKVASKLPYVFALSGGAAAGALLFPKIIQGLQMLIHQLQ